MQRTLPEKVAKFNNFELDKIGYVTLYIMVISAIRFEFSSATH